MSDDQSFVPSDYQPRTFDPEPVTSASDSGEPALSTDAVGYEPSQWDRIVAANPTHSANYIQRFRTMAANGADLVGEARLLDAMVARRSRILDAGCGPGRHAGYLFAAGHQVIGVDGDAELIAAAQAEYPGPRYLVQNLAVLDLARAGITEPVDAILCAGNVLAFLAPSTRVDVLRRFHSHLAPTGRIVAGFGAGRGYEFGDFLHDAETAGLSLQSGFSTWDLQPFTDDSTFLVAILVRADT